MKQILVAIDFSRCSVHALEYAIMIANRVHADIIMVWVDNRSSSESVFPDLMGDTRKEITQSFSELVEQYAPTLTGGRIHFKIRTGKVHHEVANQAKYSDANLVIAGTHGVSGFEEFWIGSNAYRIVTYAPCPVITLRADYKIPKTISRIVLPIDSTLETRQKVPFSALIAKYFDSEVHVLGMFSTSIKAVRTRVTEYTNQVARYLEEEKVRYHLEMIEAEQITNTTIDYARRTDADIISIMTEQETTTANLFLGAFAQQMVNHAPIPVLSIHSKEYIRIQSR
ncbi:MAG: universal stress protein [Bacteroidales bacterium]|nr:universal stress protein [Bacteroidales bacterium]